MLLTLLAQLKVSNLPVEDPSFPTLVFVYVLFVLSILIFTVVTLRKINITRKIIEVLKIDDVKSNKDKEIPENPFLKNQSDGKDED